MIIESILIAVALVVVAIVAFRLKYKKKKKPKPSLYKPRTTESIQSLQVKTEKPKAPKPVKVLKVQEKKEKKEFTTKHEPDQHAKNERNVPAPRKVINTLERTAAKQEETLVKKEFKLVKKISTAAAPDENSKATDTGLEVVRETKAAPVDQPIEVKEHIPIVVTNFAEFVMDKFDQQYYSVKKWENGRFVGETESLSHLPHLEVEFTSKRTINIALETIWIESFTRGGLDWATGFDLKDLKQFFFKKRMPYFIVIGVGGSEIKPRELFIVPLAKIETEFLSKADLLHYQKNKVNSSFFYDYSSNILR